MTDDAHTLISVRGEAERVVAPDAARLSTAVSVVAASKVDAAAIVGRALARLTAALSELGGESLTLMSMRAPLTWSTHGIHSHEDWDHGDDKRRVTRHRATAEVAITVREFGRLDELTRALGVQDEVSVYSVFWTVDEDNAAWAQVRADAIHAALLKGRDYAAALGGTVVSVEHVADSGLLGESSGRPTARRASTQAAYATQSDDVEGVSLDPVPQTITAVIEARVSATVGPLPG